jgi:predicted Holliday junction resolvase-like endonuclease
MTKKNVLFVVLFVFFCVFAYYVHSQNEKISKRISELDLRQKEIATRVEDNYKQWKAEQKAYEKKKEEIKDDVKKQESSLNLKELADAFNSDIYSSSTDI